MSAVRQPAAFSNRRGSSTFTPPPTHGRILLEGNPKTLPGEHGKETLEELFITVAREPLTLESG